MPLVQVRDVPQSTVDSLKQLAAERGLTLAAFLRAELDRLATRPSNAEIVNRLARRERSGGPLISESVAEIRRVREAS
jgi:antitoxin FitA